MHFSIFLLFFVIKNGEQKISSFYEGSSNSEGVLSCVNRIVKHHFDLEDQITILTQGSKDYVKGIESTVQLIGNISKLDKISWLTQTKQAVVFLDGDSHRDNLNVLISLGNFHPLSRFLIVVCTTIVDNGKLSKENYLTKVVHHLHENQRWEIAIAVKSDGDEDLSLYGYTKTAHKNCGNPEILSFGKCSDEKSVKRLFSNNLNYNRCPLRLATFDWPPFTQFVTVNGIRKSIGIESSLIDIIVERLNASKFFVAADPSEVRTIIGNRNADIGYGQMALYDNNLYLYSKTWCFVRGVVLVPKYSSVVNSALDNFMPLETTVWGIPCEINQRLTLCTIADLAFRTKSAMVWMAIIFVVIVLIILRSFLQVFKVIPMLNIFALLLGLGVKVRPIRMSQRVYFMSLILFGYIITQAYLANLTMVFTKASDHGGFRSLEELDRSTVPIGGGKLSARYFENKYPRLYREYKKMGLNEFKQNLVKLRTGRGGLATYVEVSKYISYKHWKQSVIVPETITSYPVSIILPNSSDILSICDSTMTAILEAGLIDQWADVINHQTLLENAIKELQTEDDGPKDLQQFLAIFLLLGMALALSFIVFIIELLAGFWQRRKKKQQYEF